MNLFVLHNDQEHAEILAQYLPGGEVFAGKADSDKNLFKLLLGFATQYRLIEQRLELAFEQYDIRDTVDFLSEWESAVGIPDECFSGTGTDQERLRDLNVKFLSDTVVTNDDFVAVAAIYGVTVTITNGIDDIVTFPLTFPTEFSDIRTARFTMIVEFMVDDALKFPLTFPIPFGDETIEVLKCLFRKLAPANVDVIFRQV